MLPGFLPQRNVYHSSQSELDSDFEQSSLKKSSAHVRYDRETKNTQAKTAPQTSFATQNTQAETAPETSTAPQEPYADVSPETSSAVQKRNADADVYPQTSSKATRIDDQVPPRTRSQTRTRVFETVIFPSLLVLKTSKIN